MEVLAAPGSNPAPTLIGVSPNQAYNYQTTSITITGADLSAIPTVTMGNVALTNVTFVDSTTITAVVPADLPGGIYSITVRNPDGQSASLANAFTILRSGDGGVGVWQTTSAMTTPRNALAAVAASKYLYALGGYNADYVLSCVDVYCL
jgi:hypothetical protein